MTITSWSPELPTITASSYITGDTGDMKYSQINMGKLTGYIRCNISPFMSELLTLAQGKLLDLKGMWTTISLTPIYQPLPTV